MKTCFKRLRRWWQQFRDGLPAMEKTSPHLCNGPAAQPERLSFALLWRRSRCAAGHGIIGGLRYSVGRTELAVRRRAKRQIEAGGQRFSEVGMAVRVHLVAMDLIIITSAACSLDDPASGKRPRRPAVTLSERHASTPSRKRSLSVGMERIVRRDAGTSRQRATAGKQRPRGYPVDGRYNGNPAGPGLRRLAAVSERSGSWHL